MSNVKQLSVTEDEDGMRLDRWFKRHFPGLPHSKLEKLLRTGQVRVDGSRAKSKTRIETGQSLRIPPNVAEDTPAREATKVHKSNSDPKDIENLRQAVLYKDSDIIVLNKPPGLAVQGGSKIKQNIDAMLDYLKFDYAERPKLVHRLDKDTSGILLLARTRSAAAKLTEAFRSHETQKIYWAAVVGAPRPTQGKIDMPLLKRESQRGERMERESLGKQAITYYRVLEVAGNRASWLELEPVTGRTHQLRVHCAAIGHPIIGDGKYGGSGAFPTFSEVRKLRLHLHARAIRFPHPNGRMMEFEAQIPEHIAKSWKFLGFSEESGDSPFAERDLIPK